MIIYGVSLLSFCYLVGQIIGELLGNAIGVDSNVGGVGFAMLLLILLSDFLKKKNLFSIKSEKGIEFWSQMYIPIIVAMASIQNVKVAVTSGMLAILAGLIPLAVCFITIPLISKLGNSKKISH
jgi:malonate transporter MadL subunit